MNDINDEGRLLPTRPTKALPVEYIGRPSVPQGTGSETDDITVLKHYLEVLWKHKWVLVLTSLLGLAAGLGQSLRTLPTYFTSTSMEIDNAQDPITPFTTDNLNTQVQLLSSQTLRNRVIAKLRNTPPQFPKTQDQLASLREFFGLNDPGVTMNWGGALGMAAGTRKVVPSKDSRILRIESRSFNPQAAADFANTLAAEFIAKNKEERVESYQETGDWLRGDQDALKLKVEESERRLQNFARDNGLIITGSHNATEEKLRMLQAELGRATADRIEKETKYRASLSESNKESLPAVLDSGPIGQIQGALTTLRQELAKLSTTLTRDNPTIGRIEAQIKELETTRDRERKNIISRIEIDFDAAKRKEAQLEEDYYKQVKVLDGQGEQLIQYNILLREVETYKKLYDQTLSQVKEIGMASAMRARNVRVIDPAGVPRVPDSPSLMLNLWLGLIGGAACGTALVIFRSVMDERIHGPGLLYHLRELGTIPSASMFPEFRGARFLRGVVGKGRRKAIGPGLGVTTPQERPVPTGELLELLTWTHKTSVMSEAYRAVMTSILLSSNGEVPQVMVVSSSAPQEGKTSATTNLAIALAEINRRVLLIDADMRRPRAHTIFDLPNTSGLSDFLHERRPVGEYVEEELVRKTSIPNLHTMLAGPARSNLARLLYSGRMKELLIRFRGTFDIILIDCAPVLSVPDARILGRLADGVILVVRAHRTSQEAAFAAVRCFEEDGCHLLGTILNDWNPKRSPNTGYAPYGAYTPYDAE